jgi:hypothetical protein
MGRSVPITHFAFFRDSPSGSNRFLPKYVSLYPFWWRFVPFPVLLSPFRAVIVVPLALRTAKPLMVESGEE